MMAILGMLVHMSHTKFMEKALKLAKKAQELDEVPVGAVIIDQNENIVGQGYNRTRIDKDPSAHAEVVAIRDACSALKQHRLDGCTLFVTLEPCAMCAQALAHARIKRLVYGAKDPKGGGVCHGAQIFEQPTCHHKIEVVSEIMPDTCGQLLKDFFVEKRRKNDIDRNS